ncbi:MAG: hypothetical protein ACYDA8_16940 [Deferrisomatales bacterium]
MTETPTRSPCPEHRAACEATAWGLGDEPTFATHRQGCRRCRDALAAAERLARRAAPARPVPADARRGLAEAVFARTTRREPAASRRAWAWAGVGAGLAAAGAAFLALRRPPGPVPGDALELADVDPDLLRDLELAEDLELLELLDALEALDHV